MASHPITLTRKKLYERVWFQPVHTLAKESVAMLCAVDDRGTPCGSVGDLYCHRTFKCGH
jgi:hypothetical protein